MNKFQSIRSQMAIIEQNGLLKDVLANIGFTEDKKSIHNGCRLDVLCGL